MFVTFVFKILSAELNSDFCTGRVSTCWRFSFAAARPTELISFCQVLYTFTRKYLLLPNGLASEKPLARNIILRLRRELLITTEYGLRIYLMTRYDVIITAAATVAGLTQNDRYDGLDVRDFGFF